MKTTTWIVGEAPGPRGDADSLDGATGYRIARLLRITFEQLSQRARLENLLAEYPGPSFPAREGKAAARELAARFRERERVLLFGQNVARAFALCSASTAVPVLEWAWRDVFGKGMRVAVVPHPSGLNRWWNDPAAVDCVRQFLWPVFRLPADDSLELFPEAFSPKGTER